MQNAMAFKTILLYFEFNFECYAKFISFAFFCTTAIALIDNVLFGNFYNYNLFDATHIEFLRFLLYCFAAPG